MNLLEKDELKELLIKCWMTHDGMWFYHCLQNFGMEKANALNLASIRSLSEVEVPRIAKALRIQRERIKNFEELKEVIHGLFGVVKANFMEFKYDFPSENRMRWEVQRCFAHEGMKRMGVIDRYQCGLLYRVKCWIDVLGLKCDITPRWGTCGLHHDGNFSGEIEFFF
jgi:hypothetical protein